MSAASRGRSQCTEDVVVKVNQGSFTQTNKQTGKWAKNGVERVTAHEMRNKFSFMSVTSIVAAIFICIW